jgi:hypothetical protein
VLTGPICCAEFKAGNPALACCYLQLGLKTPLGLPRLNAYGNTAGFGRGPTGGQTSCGAFRNLLGPKDLRGLKDLLVGSKKCPYSPLISLDILVA